MNRGLPYGGVMATAGASTLAGDCGWQEWVVPLLALAVLQALWVPATAGIWRRAGTATTRWPTGRHAGMHTVPLGLAVITGGLAGLPVADTTPWLILLVMAGLALTWLLTLICIGRFVGSLARCGMDLAKMDGAWFLVPAALLGAAMAAQAAAGLGAGRWWAACLVMLASSGALVGMLGYWMVAIVAFIRVNRHGLGGVPQAPWWIAMGCAGLAAAALGRVTVGVDFWPSAVASALMAVVGATQLFAVILCVPVLVGSAWFVLRRCRFRGAAVWPPTFSTAVFALGALQAGVVLASPALRYLGLGAGFATLGFWIVTAAWNTGCGIRRCATERG